MSGFRITLINAGWLVSDRLVRLILNFFVGLLIARHIGPEGLGLLSYGQVLTNVLLPLATLGLPDILVRELSKSKRDPDTIIATALTLRLGSALLALLCTTIIVLTARSGERVAILVVIAYGLSFIPQSADVIESRFQSLNRVGWISTLRMINSFVFAGARLGALFLGLSLPWFALLSTIEVLAFAVLTFAAAHKQGIRVRIRMWSSAEAKSLLTDSWPLMLRLQTVALYMRVDQLMIQHWLGDRPLGIYSAAIRISELWYFVPMAIIVAAAPNLTRQYEECPETYKLKLRRLLKIMVVMSVSTALILSIFSSLIIHLLYGPAYAEAAPLLTIQAWAGVFVAMSVASGPWFVNTGNMRYGLYQAIAGMITSICLNYLLIPVYGLAGAAASLVVSYAISTVLLNAFFRNTRALFLMQMQSFALR